MDDTLKAEILDLYNKNLSTCRYLQEQVEGLFKYKDILNVGDPPAIHSIKSRIKNQDHLLEKIERKLELGRQINKENFFTEITDLVGLRVLYLYQDQFYIIHTELMREINEIREWCLHEQPKAYTWDPESKNFYESLGITTELKDSYYTSVHYTIKKNNDSNQIRCEIQIRSLFEEIWGEIDHTINYPKKTDSLSCMEQIKVLSKLVATGTRLSDSIFRSYNEHKEQRNT